MLALFKKRETVASVSPAVPAEPVRSEGAESVYALAQVLQRDCSGLGLEAAQLRGALDDSAAIATRQTTALSELQTQASQIAEAQQRIQAETMQSQQAMQRARASVEHVGEEVAGVVSTLKQVSDAASQIEPISRAIVGAVASRDQRIQPLSQARRVDVQADAAKADQGRQVHLALVGAESAVQRIVEAAGASSGLSQGIQEQVGRMGQEVDTVRNALAAAAKRSERVLGFSERLMEFIATCGVETAYTPYIQLAQQVAGQIAQRLEQAVGSGRINL